MPRFDWTGPFGTGPVGRWLGPCRQQENTNLLWRIWNWFRGFGWGRWRGKRLWGKGYGRWRGRGWGRWWWFMNWIWGQNNQKSSSNQS
jgi:hypothetical protein